MNFKMTELQGKSISDVCVCDAKYIGHTYGYSQNELVCLQPMWGILALILAQVFSGHVQQFSEMYTYLCIN